MTLIACIANNNGILFNKRRVSKDALLIERLREIINTNILYCSEYSKSLFSDFNNLTNDITSLTNDSFYFLEDENIPNIIFNKIIIYKWNRDYPADKFFEYDLSEYTLESQTDFKGNSHDLITELIYTKEI